MKGSILILGLLMMAILLMIGGVFLSLTLTNVEQLQLEGEYIKAEYLALAGLNRTFHDLKEGYADHQSELKDIEFGEGKSRVGTVPLSRLGIHEILIVSGGIIKNPLSKSLVNKVQAVISGVVKLKTPTDYALFVDGDEPLRVGQGDAPLALIGPVHVNGNLYFKIWQAASDAPVFISMLKPKELRGPVIDVSKRVIYEGIGSTRENYTGFQYQNVKIVAGIGSYVPDNEWTAKYSDFKWRENPPLVFGEATGLTTYSPNNHELKASDYYPLNKKEGPTPDITGEGILQDQDHGGENIVVPKAIEVNESLFADYIDNNWKIDSANFVNSACKKTGFVNEALTKKVVLDKGKWDGDISTVDNSNNYTFNYTPSNREIHHVYFVKDSPEYPKYSDGTTPVVIGSPGYSAPSDLDPHSVPGSTVRVLLARGPDDTFTASGGTLTLNNGDYWKPYILNWFVAANCDYTGSKWVNSTYNEQIINVADGIAKERPIKAFKLEFDEPALGTSKYNVDGSLINLINPPVIYFDGTGGKTQFNMLTEAEPAGFKYYWATSVTVDGVARTEAAGYIGQNNYTTPPTGANEFYRQWNSGSNEFFIKFVTAPPAGTNNIQVTLGKWWFPTAGIYTYAHKIYYQQYPPKDNVFVLTDQWIEAIEIDLSKINSENCPRDPTYPLGFADYNNNKIQDEGEPSKFGIIYSKVPLIIKGSPKVPVTILCEDDVYLKSINMEYAEDSAEAKPVGIMTKKVAWIFHGEENTIESRAIILNKVVILSATEKLYDYGGIGTYWWSNPGEWITNRTKLIGTLWKSKIDKSENESYYKAAAYAGGTQYAYWTNRQTIAQQDPWYRIGDTINYFTNAIPLQIKYAATFRNNPPVHIPIDFHTVGIRGIKSTSAVESFFEKIKPYTKTKEFVPAEVYQDLLNIIGL